MDSPLRLIFVAAAASAHIISPIVQPGYISPAATGYIYRSDNNGPASLIQLGAPNYQLPQLLTKPVYEVPVPLPYVAAEPIVVEDAEDDSDEIESDELIDHGHAYEKGAGSDYEEENHAAHGGKGSKSYRSKDHHAKGESGHYGKEHKEGYDSEAEGEKGSHHDAAEEHGNHHEAAKGYKGADQGHKKHFSKGEEVTGYHKVFNKDEYKKDHDFYDESHNSGKFNKHAYEKGQHGSEAGGHKKGGHKDAAYAEEESGKSGHHAKGQHDESDASQSTEEGDESHYENEAEYAKKAGSDDGKEYAYDDEDDDYDE